MKNNFLFLFSLALILALFSCSKEEVIETQAANSTTQISQNSNFRGRPLTGVARLSPYVEQAGVCYGNGHSGYDYETVVYAQGTKPYERRVTVYGWKNGVQSGIPNTYSLVVPANATSSNRVSTFSNATSAYSSILVEVYQVLKQDASGQWVEDNSATTTSATVSVQNCYNSTGGGGGGFGVPSL